MNTYYVAGIPYSDELWHYGIKGQKWGLRRYQNPDGTYTAEGKIRYGVNSDKQAEKLSQYQENEYSKSKVKYDAGIERLQNKKNKLEGKLAEKLSGYLPGSSNSKESRFLDSSSMSPRDKKKMDKLRSKIDKTDSNIEKLTKLSDRVLKNVGDMKYSDMRREKNLRAVSVVSDIMTSAVINMALVPATGGWHFFMHTPTQWVVDGNREKIANKQIKA